MLSSENQNMKIYLGLLISLTCVFRLSSCQQTFLYEKMHRFGQGRRIIQDFRRAKGDKAYLPTVDTEHPKALPTPNSTPYVKTPWQNLYQGVARPGDVKVFDKNFDFAPRALGHQITSSALFNCFITHLAVETDDGIPIIIRGGAGNRHFGVLVKARAEHSLKGRIRAFCRPSTDEYFPPALLIPNQDSY